MSNHPQLLFVAGPNGAGKSTFSKLLSEPDAIIFDVDKVIARIQAQSPDTTPKQVYQVATDEFFNQAEAAVRLRLNFTLETNFRDDHLANLVAQFKGFGYTTNIIYLTLDSIKQSVLRVNQRVKNGGHDVDLKNIQQNFDLGLEYLERYTDSFDNVEILDSAGIEGELHSLLSIQNRKLEYISNNVPDRIAKTVNAIIERFTPPPPKQELRPYRGPRR